MSDEWFYFENASSTDLVPEQLEFMHWVRSTLKAAQQPEKELSIRVVDNGEMQTINHQFRNQDKATNVLSFPFNAVLEEQSNLAWGDILICASVVIEQAWQQNKSPLSHWAHMTIHGTLHLLSFDHIEDVDAAVMEGQEIKIMTSLGFDNPYQDRSYLDELS